jgi:hypothetical protein
VGDRERFVQEAEAQQGRDRDREDPQPRPFPHDSGWREVADIALAFVKRFV